MFGRTFKIGTLLGFRIELSITFLILIGFFALQGGMAGGFMGAIGGALAVVMLSSMVLLHELGHAVVARRLGIRILGIELHIIGGAAKMASPPGPPGRRSSSPSRDRPCPSGWEAFLGLYLVTEAQIIGFLALLNLILAVFNLLPALPMDGGRVLRAALSERMGRLKATHVAASIAQGLAATMVLLGIAHSIRPFLFIAGTSLSGFALIIVGLMVWVMAAQERAMAGRWRYDDEMPQPQVLDANGNVIAGDPVSSGAHHLPNPRRVGPHGAPDLRRGAAGEPVRRVYRLPNGTVMVVEEHVRW